MHVLKHDKARSGRHEVLSHGAEVFEVLVGTIDQHGQNVSGIPWDPCHRNHTKPRGTCSGVNHALSARYHIEAESENFNLFVYKRLIRFIHPGQFE